MRTRRRTVLSIVAMLLTQLFVAAGPASAADPTVQRLAGPNRFATAVAVSQEQYAGGAPVAFIATGGNPPDALSVSAAAAGVGPVLLVERDRLPSETAAELRRLAPASIIVVGGPMAVSEQTLIDVARFSTGSTRRIAGSDRYATSAAVSREAFDAGTAVAFVTTGDGFQDALSSTASAAAFDAPLLLTTPTALPASIEEELQRLTPQRIVVVGSTTDVSDAVVTRLTGLAPEVIRIADPDDAVNSAMVARATFTSSAVAFLATSAAYPDGLAGGAFAGALPAPLMLVAPDQVSDAVKCELVRLGTTHIVVLGGPKAVSDGVVAELDAGYAAGDIPGCRAPMFTAVEGAPLRGMTIDPTSTYGYVTNPSRNIVQVVELRSGNIVGQANTGSEPADVDLSPDGGTLYVSNNGGQDIWRYSLADPRTPTYLGRVRIEDAPLNEVRAWTLEVLSTGQGLIAPTTFNSTDGDELLRIDLSTGATTPVTVVDVVTPEETTDDTTTDDTTTDDTTTDDGTTDDTTTEEPAEAAPAGIVRMVPNADASQVALSIGSDLYIYRVTTNEARGGYNGGAPVNDIAFARDGSTILVDDGAGTTFVLNSALQLEGTIRGDGPTAGVALSNDGNTGYRVDIDTGVEILSIGRFLPTGEVLEVADEPLAAPGDSTVELSPNGRYLVLLTANGFQITVL